MAPTILAALQGPPILPIDATALLAVFMGTLMFLIPIAGLTLRFAIKPVAEALARMRESTLTNETIQMLERRISLVEQETVSVLEVLEEVRRLKQALDFERQLGQGAGDRHSVGGSEPLREG